MASPPSLADFQNSGFYSSANIPALQEQLAKYSVDDSKLRQQAEAQYAPAYNMQKTNLQNQLNQINAARDRDVKKINTQYDKSLNSVMAQLNDRGLGRSSLVSTRGVETENARNAAVADASLNYLQKQSDINANIQQADAEFAQNVENRAVEMRDKNQSQYITLLSQIAQLQQSGYSAYASYLQSQ